MKIVLKNLTKTLDKRLLMLYICTVGEAPDFHLLGHCSALLTICPSGATF